MTSTPSARPAQPPAPSAVGQPSSTQQVSQQLPRHDVLSQRDFLASFGPALTERVAEASPPAYRGPADAPWAPLSLLMRKPLGAQGLIAQAGAFAIRGVRPSRHADNARNHAGHFGQPDTETSRRRRRGLGLVAEMATGKSYLSLAMLGLADEEVTRRRALDDQRPEKARFFPAVVLSPPIVVEKWAREAAATLPSAHPVVIRPLRTKSDVAAFRRFDPTFTGTRLSAIACADRVARRIRQELATWRERCDRAVREGKTPPRKPCHVAILSTSVAKLGPAWTPIYLMRVLRETDDDGHVRALRDAATGEPYVVPCCPRCFQPLKDEARAERREREQAKQRRRQEPGGPHGALRLRDHEGGDDSEEDDEALAVYLTEAELLGQRGPAAKRVCASCGEPLWQVIPDNVHWRATPPPLAGRRTVVPLPLPDCDHRPPFVTSTFERRYPLADYLRKRHRGLFRSLICDEAHQFKGVGTAQGFAAASLVDACNPGGTTLFLTGTLFSGYCSDLYPMLWRLLPELRQTFGYSDLKRWMDLYGVRQKVVKVREGRREDGSRSKRREDKPLVKELPGISPLVLRHLLDSCLFLELADVAPGLPPYSEEALVVSLGEPLGPVYERFERETTAVLKQMLARYDNSGLAAWFQGLMIQPNLPWRGITVTSPSGELLGSAPPLPAEVIYPKERALLDLSRRERAAGRRMLVYCEHTGEYDLLPRLKALLEADDAAWRKEVRARDARQWEAGEAVESSPVRDEGGVGEEAFRPPAQPIRVTILRSGTVSTSEREAWLQRTVEQGCDVLLCHSGLVEVGLDLLAFPTIVCDEVIFSTTRVRQATRRSYRPGQAQPVKVVQLVYDRSMEARGLQLIASKIKSSLMVEGKLPGEGLAAFGQSAEDQGNLLLELARSVLADSEGGARDVAGSLEATFRELAAAEEQQDGYIGDVALPTVIVEDDFDVEAAESQSESDGALDGAAEIAEQAEQHLRAGAGDGVGTSADSGVSTSRPIAQPPTIEDPWARWRELQRQAQLVRGRTRPEPRRGRATTTVPTPGGSLWATPATAPSLPQSRGSRSTPADASPTRDDQPSEVVQKKLWSRE